ncbi:hypothetical protein EOPP23_10890 [Endozoicomonas sp. OPT23]|uniref:hypothetical protein n=1 Tax=Endozoicomonas sp. OPT23 TaxID=2072845 RepID=UPI00129AC2AD|nr:hypothetical protein [Endozoicomonas sp. OPT23]MRI33491.1 hypothetical protein [Endozoicomonas sp. OPT23]
MNLDNKKTAITGPTHLVMASEGVELFDLGEDRQISFFTVYDHDKEESQTFQIPKLVGSANGEYLQEGQTKDSLPIVSTLYEAADGTLYIGGAGGVLNRMTPNGAGGYSHSFAILSKPANHGTQLRFQENPVEVKLLAVGDQIKHNPEVTRVVGGQKAKVGFFDAYEKRSSNPDYDVLVEKGILDNKGKDALWKLEKQKYNKDSFTVQGEVQQLKKPEVSLDSGYQHLRSMTDDERESSPMRAFMESKGGPTKRICLKIWERNTDYFSKEGTIIQGGIEKTGKVVNADLLKPATEKLVPGLWSDWENNLIDPIAEKLKIFDERLLIHRVNVSGDVEDENQVLVCVKDQLYRLDNTTGVMTCAGKIQHEADRDIDIRALVPLNHNTFILGDMGTVQAANGPATFRVVVDNGQGAIKTDQAMTKTLQDSFKANWREPTAPAEPNGTPRVENLMYERLPKDADGSPQTKLLVRTKHVGADLVEGKVTFGGRSIQVSDVKKVDFPDKTNNEYMALYNGKPIPARQLECVMRASQMSVKGYVKSAEDINLCEYLGDGSHASLPKWNYFTATGCSSIAVK